MERGRRKSYDHDLGPAFVQQEGVDLAISMMDQAQALIESAKKLIAKKSREGIEEYLVTATRVDNSLEQARKQYAQRRLRDRIFDDPTLFADPAWDILLDLYAAQSSAKKMSTSSLCIASNVPPTTALRWISLLEDKGLITRSDDVHDGRRTNVEMTQQCLKLMGQYFRQTAGATYVIKD